MEAEMVSNCWNCVDYFISETFFSLTEGKCSIPGLPIIFNQLRKQPCSRKPIRVLIHPYLSISKWKEKHNPLHHYFLHMKEATLNSKLCCIHGGSMPKWEYGQSRVLAQVLSLHRCNRISPSNIPFTWGKWQKGWKSCVPFLTNGVIVLY